MLLCSVLVRPDEVTGKRVLDVGSQDINGSFRTVITPMQPELYLGVDMAEGQGVDEVVNVHELTNHFEEESFDIVISTEAIEHILDWRSAINQIKRMVKRDGMLVLTSRSRGFGFHAYPHDHWRYELQDIRNIFHPAMWEIEVLTKDMFNNDHYGFFMKAWRRTTVINSLEPMKLFNIHTDRRMYLNNPPDVQGMPHPVIPRRILDESELTEAERNPPVEYWR